MDNLIESGQTVRHRPGKWWRVALMLALALVAGMFMRATLLMAAPVEVGLAENVLQEANHDGDDDFISHHGILDSRPDGITGTWVIDNRSYTVTRDTVLEEKRGALEVGVCVEVKAQETDPNIAIKIETKEAFKCNDREDDHDDDDRNNDDRDNRGDGHRNEIKRYGILENQPDGITGTWVIDSRRYSVTEETILEEDHGALEVGVCVEVKSQKSEPSVATKIESESEYKCRGREHDEDHKAEGKVFGVVTALPEDLNDGEWVIGNTTYVVSSTTELVSKRHAFTVGVTVKVDFYTDSDDVNYARKIEIKFGRGHLCHQHNHHPHNRQGHGGDAGGLQVNHNDHGNHGNYGYCPGAEGKTYGLIEIRPTDILTGEWQIGGVIYLADGQTRFYQTDDLRVGERVKVEYVVDSEGNRRATKIQESLDNGGLHHPHNSKLVGFVDDKPDAFVGTWLISDVSFEADADTIFLERAGVFEVGAYVVVEYSITDDMRLIYEIRTHVPPGAGDSDLVGNIESIGGAQVSGALPTAASTVWTVSGVNYVVTEATQLVDSGGDLAIGAEVAVNSYTEDGQEVATSIRLLDGKLFIPAAARHR